MKILHIIHSANPVNGGPIEGVRQLSAVNLERGHTVEVVTMDPPDAPWIENFPVRIHATGPSYLGYGYTPRLAPWLEAHRRDFDIVVVNGLWQYGGYCAWNILRNTNTPYCVFPHGMLDPWFKREYPLKHLKKWLYWPWGEYRILRDALAVFFTCEEERRLARRSFWLYKCDEIVVNYGTRGAEGDAAKQREIFLSAHPRLRGKRILLFLGRFHKKKGADLLLDAFRHFLNDKPEAARENLALVMAGPQDPVDVGFLEKAKDLCREFNLDDKVVWTGMLKDDMKWGAFHSAEAFILPSHQENFGIAVAEALSCSLPVLISNKINIWREVTLHGAGLVESDDSTGTRLLLERWWKLPQDERAAMRLRALECFQTRFEVTSTGNTFISALHMLGMPK